jgi:hypothetical protein
MTKPIGNLIANIKTYDKVSGKIKARYAPKSVLPLSAAPGAAAAAPARARRPAKFKTRKR